MRKIFLIFFVLFLSCYRGKKEKIKIISTEIIEAETDYYIGNIVEVSDNYIYLYGLGKPLTRFNIFSEKLDTIFFSKDEYIFSVKEKDGYIYIHSSGILKRIGGGIKYVCKIGIDGYFKFLTDEMIVLEDFSSIKDYFLIININNGKRIITFGDIIEYPDVKFKDKLKYDRFKIPYPEFEWDVKGSLLVVYEYFFDRLKAYDIIRGKAIKIFGEKHREWTLPALEITGKGKNRVYKIKKTPAAGIAISDNYIFLCLEKYWFKKWEINKYPNRLKKLYRKGFFLIDVYRRKDFEYVGTLYPLNDEHFYYDGLYLRIWRFRAENDSTLTFYLQDNRNETFFRKIKVVFQIN